MRMDSGTVVPLVRPFHRINHAPHDEQAARPRPARCDRLGYEHVIVFVTLDRTNHVNRAKRPRPTLKALDAAAHVGSHSGDPFNCAAASRASMRRWSSVASNVRTNV